MNSSAPTDSSELTEIAVNEIGEYIRHRSCERRFKLGLKNRELAKRLPFSERLFNPLDPVLQEEGRKREDEWAQSLRDAGLEELQPHSSAGDGNESLTWKSLIELFRTIGRGSTMFAREVTIDGEIGSFLLHGRIDFVILRWADDGPRLRLVESKASRKDRTYHRIQLAVYKMLVEQSLAANPIELDHGVIDGHSVECIVVRIDETTSKIQDILSMPDLNLELEVSDIHRLLAEDGQLAQIVNSELDSLPYQLDAKCDGCVFNVDCLPESGRNRRLELLGIDPSAARALRRTSIVTIDDLADLDETDPRAQQVRGAQEFTRNLDHLIELAKARRTTLPGGRVNPDEYQVSSLPMAGHSQLPEHVIAGVRLVRVYLCVDYDYTENRIGALSAHVTNSDAQIHTGFLESADRKFTPDPQISERFSTGESAEGKTTFDHRPLPRTEVIRYKSSAWTGDYAQDTGAERELIQGFLGDLIDLIAETAASPTAPIHIYVWSRSEVTQLVEGCTRGGSELLGHLRELLGCRQPLDQLIYSCLHDEVVSRFSRGWTGTGLAVLSSLAWYGRVFHWHRLVGGSTVSLDQVFTQDIFDFKTDLGLTSSGEWAHNQSETARMHKFEVRSRFHDNLPAPYWRAAWGTLPDPQQHDLDANVKTAIRRYQRSARPSYLQEYLRARTHALRWIEEGVRYKNPEVNKPFLQISELRNFSLGVDTTAQAALDFLRLDHHVKYTDWVVTNLAPPAHRISQGKTIPLRNIRRDGKALAADIDLTGFDITREDLEQRTMFKEGDFVRVSPWSGDPHAGQSIKQLTTLIGSTCIVERLDWGNGHVWLKAIPGRGDRYVLGSNSDARYAVGTLDESISDFVARRTDDWLSSHASNQASYAWLNPREPRIPDFGRLDDASRNKLENVLDHVRIDNLHPLAADQAKAIIDGLETRIQLLQGPPGTGKTVTSAHALLLRLLARRSLGDVVIVAAHTHTAIDTLLQRLDQSVDAFKRASRSAGISPQEVSVMKVYSSNVFEASAGGVEYFSADSCVRLIDNRRKSSIVVIGGTTSSLLKMAGVLSASAKFGNSPDGFQTPLLIVDEASMMPFAHFLALSTLVKEDGEMMLTGDHRQLAPIVSHDWENEDRPPIVLYQPYVSAFEAVRNIAQQDHVGKAAVCQSALSYTFRLPQVIRSLISRLYERLDDIELTGPDSSDFSQSASSTSPWERIWEGKAGLFLILHDERESRSSNPVEAEIIGEVLSAAPERGRPEPSVAIVTPHRAQRTLLRSQLADNAMVDVIDTVERLQGGERPVVIVSATESDPAAISASVEFILNLNRSNVAFSRSKERLIVVCSSNLIDHVPVEMDQYESTMLWKSLREICCHSLGDAEIRGHRVRIMTPPPSVIHEARQDED